MQSNAKTANAGFTDDEKAAMRARAKELLAEQKMNKNRALGEAEVVAAIKALTQPDRTMAMELHELVKEVAPNLWPKTWYGMPAYASEGRVVCFFQSADKFKARYATFGFNDAANLDDGDMWATSFALKKLTPAAKAKISELVKKAVS